MFTTLAVQKRDVRLIRFDRLVERGGNKKKAVGHGKIIPRDRALLGRGSPHFWGARLLPGTGRRQPGLGFQPWALPCGQTAAPGCAALVVDAEERSAGRSLSP